MPRPKTIVCAAAALLHDALLIHLIRYLELTGRGAARRCNIGMRTPPEPRAVFIHSEVELYDAVIACPSRSGHRASLEFARVCPRTTTAHWYGGK
jgi:hypothetical protein